MSGGNPSSVSAAYTYPNETRNFAIDIKSPCTDARTAERTQYLNELRSSTKQLQADINRFLTDKMEQDKKSHASGHSKTVDEHEEQTYGEEQAEED